MTGETEAQHRALAKEVSKETIRQTFEALGVDISTPEARREFRESIAWVRSLQRLSSRTGAAAVWILVTLFLSGVVAAFWSGFKNILGKG